MQGLARCTALVMFLAASWFSEPAQAAQDEPGRLVEHGLMLVAPPAEVVLGLWRTDALVRDARIKKVVFLVDGTVQVTRTRPPYTAELRLASTSSSCSSR